MVKGDRSQSSQRPEASVGTIRLWLAGKHYAGQAPRSLGLESRMPSKGPVRFGRGRLDSLARKGLAAYLITRWKKSRAELTWPGYVVHD
jgi:hypothetical protein